MAPHVYDNHLFEIESRLLNACEKLQIFDDVLLKLNYKMSHLNKNFNKKQNKMVIVDL